MVLLVCFETKENSLGNTARDVWIHDLVLTVCSQKSFTKEFGWKANTPKIDGALCFAALVIATIVHMQKIDCDCIVKSDSKTYVEDWVRIKPATIDVLSGDKKHA